MLKEDKRLAWVYFLALSLFAVGFVFYLRNRDLLSWIEAFAAKNLIVAWLLMLSLYVFRAFIPFLPSFAFYAMSGRIFPGKVIPFAVSLSGVTLLYILSYLIGLLKKRHVSSKAVRIPLWRRYRMIRERMFYKLANVMKDRHFGTLLFLSLSPFPQKLLGRVCGRMRMNFSVFLTAALLGTTPEVMSVTLLGKSISDLSSPLFYVSLFMTVTVTVISMILFQKSNKKETQCSEKSN